MTAQEIRKSYLEFMAQRGHAAIPRANLVPQNDPTTLFTGSGMQPLVPYLLGDEHPAGSRLVDSQTCLRAEDIEEVGDNRHTTFFEMLGNWSLGDYFKAEQLPWFWEFLTEVVGLDPKRLYVTCFIGDEANNIPKDKESAAIWDELYAKAGIEAKQADIGSEADGYKRGMKPGERIFFYDAAKNWWSRAGVPDNMPSGEPGGPDSEVFYEFEHIEHDTEWGEHCHPNCDCGRFLEIGNSVFMEYIKQDDGSFEFLPNKNVDFGGGLERIAAVSIDSDDVFKISLMWPVIEKLEVLSSKSYDDHQEAMRVVVDHLRAAVFLAVDGVTPSNNQQGYVMRRLIRRAIRYSMDLDFTFNVCEEVAPVVLKQYEEDFPEVRSRADHVIDVLVKEEKVFRQTLRSGVRHFDKEVGDKLTGETVFKLYDTYGFPYELSIEEAEKKNIPVDENVKAAFDKHLEAQRERSRTAAKGQFAGGLGGHEDIHKKYHTATHLLYKSLRKVLGEHVIQRGSNITAERLRFDFSHPEKMTNEEIKKVEDMVNRQIERDLDVSYEEVPTPEAKEKGALGQFGDKYGDTVKVYTMQKDGDIFSYEICGGPHVEHTGELAEDDKLFKIIKEQSSSAGVRRIKAVLK